MSTKRVRKELKVYLETGKRPTEEEFAELVDSQINQLDDDIHAKDLKIGIGTSDPKEKLHVNGNIRVNRKDIFFHENPNDYNHGIGLYEGAQKKFASVNVDGPVAYGFNGGALGSNRNGNQKIALRWKENGHVAIGRRSDSDEIYSPLEVTGQPDQSGTDSILRVQGPRGWQEASVRVGVSSDGSVVNSGYIETHNGPLYINDKTNENTLLNHSGGKVGIGISNPANKLHVASSGTTTGLRLDQSGASTGNVLVLNANGNAEWAPPTNLTNSLWIKDNSTQHIRNGNSGNIGIGLLNPKEKLHVNGKTYLTNPSANNPNSSLPTTLEINSHNGAGIGIVSHHNDVMVFKRPNPNDHPGYPSKNHTPFTFLDTSEVGFRFYKSNGGARLTIANDGNSYFHDKRIHLRSANHTSTHNDQNHGLGWFGEFPIDTTDNSTGNASIDGPVVFGNGGGALGVVQQAHANGWNNATKKIALEWNSNQSVDFKGNVSVNGNPPIIVLRFSRNEEMYSNEIDFESTGPLGAPKPIWGNVKGVNTGLSVDDYGAAIIAGFSTSTFYRQYTTSNEIANNGGNGHSHTVDHYFRMYVSMFKHNNTWHIGGDILGDDEKWNIDVMFIRKEFSATLGNWNAPLNTVDQPLAP